jgi:hypothetical protein
LDLRLLLRLAFPHEAVHDEPADRYRARQTMSSCVLVDDGEVFVRETDFGCGSAGFEHSFTLDDGCGLWGQGGSPGVTGQSRLGISGAKLKALSLGCAGEIFSSGSRAGLVCDSPDDALHGRGVAEAHGVGAQHAHFLQGIDLGRGEGQRRPGNDLAAELALDGGISSARQRVLAGAAGAAAELVFTPIVGVVRDLALDMIDPRVLG